MTEEKFVSVPGLILFWSHEYIILPDIRFQDYIGPSSNEGKIHGSHTQDYRHKPWVGSTQPQGPGMGLLQK